MSTVTRGLRAVGALGLAALALALVGVGPLSAQTPEGTVITNTATVTYTDANGNSYSPVQGQVSVTVGFTAGIDVVAASATETPTAPSTDNTLSFTINNVGNGPDTVQVSESNSDPSVITNLRYQIGAATYTTLADLNTALASTEVAEISGSVTVDVLYDVPAGVGGSSSTYQMTATSVREPTVSDTDQTVVSPPFTGNVAVTPDGGQGVENLPSNGTQYTATFTVENLSTGPDTYDLAATNPNAAISIVSVNGDAGVSSTLSLNSGESQTVDVIYTVADVAAGTQDTVFLAAASQTDGSVTDDGFVDMTVVRPSLTITKEAFRDDQSTVIGAGDEVLPGEYVQYRITVENTGTAPAADVQVTDALPAEVAYMSAAGDGGTPAWSLTESSGTVTGTLPSALANGSSRYFWIRVQVQ